MLKQVQDKLRDMWDEEKANAGEGIGVLWKWWDWVGGGEFLPDLGLVEGGELQ